MDFSKASRRALRRAEHERRARDAEERQAARRRGLERRQRKSAEKARLAREILVVGAADAGDADAEGAGEQQQQQREGHDGEGAKQLKDAGGKLSADVVKALQNEPEENGAAGTRKRQRQDRQQRSVESKMWRHFDRKEGDQANPFFAAYYQEQLGMDPDGDDWAQLAATLASNLKVTFRLNRGRHPLAAAALDARLRDEFQFRGSFVRVGVDQILASGEVATPSPWARDLWQLGTDRIGFSKAAVLEPLYETLRREAVLGHLARQGIASMLPAMVLRPSPGDAVLDMCGAPGSKSEQVLQMIGPSGALVTNDSDPKRLESVFRRLKSVGHPNHLVICSRGQDLARHAGAGVFDGIICDVPCSGDGTTRKYPHLWRRWRPRHGVQLHDLQLELAKSAASLLKVGGRMVYSTCALNPVEDEAVVAALLEAANGALRLVKVDLGAFRTRQGLETWTIDDDMANAGLDRPAEDRDDQEADASRARKRARKKGRKAKGRAPDPVSVTPTMLPPSSPKRARKLNLSYCARVLPHDNDTEGFFLALIEKVADYTFSGAAEPGSNAPAAQSAEDSKELLSKLGFNPRVAADAKLPQLSFLASPPAHVLEALRDQIGLDATADPGRYVARFRKLVSRDEAVDKRFKAVLLSAKAAALVDETCASSGAVPVLRAGVEVAHMRSTGSSMAFCALPQAGLPLADALLGEGAGTDTLAANAGNVATYISPEDMMVLLQVVMASMNGDGGDDEQDDESENEKQSGRGRARKAKSSAPVLEIGQLAVVLEDEDFEDEDDLEMCQHPASNLLVDCPVHSNLVLALQPTPNTSVPNEEEAESRPEDQAAEPSTKRRMSKAERKRLKKQKNQPAQAETASASKGCPALTKEPATGLVDMFATTPAPASEMVLQLRKVSPSHVEVITDYSRILSYGLALQHHLQRDQ